jgi:hypothetical protein
MPTRRVKRNHARRTKKGGKRWRQRTNKKGWTTRSMKRSASPQRMMELDMGSPMRGSPASEYASEVFVTPFATPKRYSAKTTRKASLNPFEKFGAKRNRKQNYGAFWKGNNDIFNS